MHGLTVSLHNEPLALVADSDVQALRDYLDAYLRLRNRRAGGEAAALRVSPQKPKDKADWVTEALRALGGEATADQIYEVMLQLGYRPTARKPKEAVKTLMRQYTNLFERTGFVEGTQIPVWRLREDEGAPPASTI